MVSGGHPPFFMTSFRQATVCCRCLFMMYGVEVEVWRWCRGVHSLLFVIITFVKSMYVVLFLLDLPCQDGSLATVSGEYPPHITASGSIKSPV